MSATFIINTKTEVLKTKRTAAFWLTIVGALFIPVVNSIAYVAEPEDFARMNSQSAWIGHLNKSYEIAAAFLLPMYVILVTSLMVQVEYRNNTWKQVYASPRTYADIYFSKFLVIQLMILIYFVIFNLGIVANAYLAELVHPSVYRFGENSFPFQRMLETSGKLYISILAITAIQYWLSLRIKNYIAPLAIGLVLLIGALIILEWKGIIYYPYAYTALTHFKNKGTNNLGANYHEYYALYWFAPVVLLGFLDTVQRKERG